MNKAGSFFVFILILILCETFVYAQTVQPYPTNAEDVIASTEVFSRIDFSVKDAVKLLGKINEAEYDTKDWALSLIPFPAESKRVESVRIDTFDEQRELDSVTIEFVAPVLISFGKLRQKYGKPKLLPLPKVMCQSGDDKCRPAFVGYEFTFTPDRKKPDFGKKLEVFISLEMEWSKTLPKHTDKDFLKVKNLRFKRNTPDDY